ncbi:MAG: LamG domain-containing protein, partial [Phycisphaeraceae bacterium]|nr:LamG domain-containing protein [Phycisphaeraceae bacterium]
NNTNGLSVSETEITFDSAQDWTASGIKSLSLNIYGDPDNTGQLYLKINGTRIDYDGLSDAMQRTAWIPWNIDLSGVAGSLQNVTSLAIGVEGAGATGVIYLDEIRLYPLTPETITPVIPNDSDPNLVTYYAFEGNANDSQGNYNGTPTGDPVYTSGVAGQALVLDNVDDLIVNTFDAEVTWPAYSVSLWVKTDLFNQDLYSSLFNNNSSGADFQIEVNGNDIYGYRGGGNGQLGPVTSDWVHLTVTCDGTQTHLYYNGLFVRTVNEAQTQFGQIAIGANRGMTNLFGGILDEVRVYNRALSNAEAAGLAGITDEIPLSF